MTKLSSVRWRECVLQRYRYTFEKQFPTNSGLEWFRMDIRVEQRAVIPFLRAFRYKFEGNLC